MAERSIRSRSRAVSGFPSRSALSSHATNPSRRGSPARRAVSPERNGVVRSGHRTAIVAVSVPTPPRTASCASSRRSGQPLRSTAARKRVSAAESPMAVIRASLPAVPEGARISGWRRTAESWTRCSAATASRDSRSAAALSGGAFRRTSRWRTPDNRSVCRSSCRAAASRRAEAAPASRKTANCSVRARFSVPASQPSSPRSTRTRKRRRSRGSAVISGRGDPIRAGP